NKIRLVASESGVGVNLANVVTAQNDLTMTVDGKVSLGNINAKTDLNISSKAIEVNNSSINAGRDITLATHTLKNTGKIVAGKDMRLFADTVTNRGGNALIQANDNLWIQKDAAGALSTLVDNISGTIKTNKGDVIIRSAALYNRPENMDFHTEEVSGENKKALLARVSEENLPIRKEIGIIAFFPPQLGITPAVIKGEIKTPIKIEPNKTTITKSTIKSHTPHAVISSGKNSYLRAKRFENYQSNIEAKQNLILTGDVFYNQRWSNNRKISTALSSPPDKEEIERIWIYDETYSGKIIAGKNLALDFKDSIAFGWNYKSEDPKFLNMVSKEPI
ncbi:hypothetical protein J5224_29745, partial [Candidatus Symbiopectobacterium sp. NZEC135]|nr:hypothetical protein [Candidatus Symbiopectobacterium sp. NZEC135]